MFFNIPRSLKCSWVIMLDGDGYMGMPDYTEVIGNYSAGCEWYWGTGGFLRHKLAPFPGKIHDIVMESHWQQEVTVGREKEGSQRVMTCVPGNGIAALRSVPTAIYSFLRCMDADPDIPDHYNALQRTIIYCISLGGDTDTIATMAGAIAGAYYGEEQVPPSWEQSCEAFQETQTMAKSLYELYCQRL